MMMQENDSVILKLPVMLMRGGTSKGAYILEDDLPEDREEWEPILLKLMGSPDKKQIDGLGGSQSVTSKVAIVKKSSRADADVDYTFAQVSVDKPLVSYKGNCGNISSGVGPFAIERGLIEAKEGTTSVRIFNTNTEKVIIADVKTKDGCVEYDGDFAIAGVPGTASPVRLKFVEPSGTLGKGLLPTGNAVLIIRKAAPYHILKIPLDSARQTFLWKELPISEREVSPHESGLNITVHIDCSCSHWLY